MSSIMQYEELRRRGRSPTMVDFAEIKKLAEQVKKEEEPPKLSLYFPPSTLTKYIQRELRDARKAESFFLTEMEDSDDGEEPQYPSADSWKRDERYREFLLNLRQQRRKDRRKGLSVISEVSLHLEMLERSSRRKYPMTAISNRSTAMNKSFKSMKSFGELPSFPSSPSSALASQMGGRQYMSMDMF
uniref:Uncharacterized protein n=1 Tax=Palpitomonas bilix TaxID=652834 RepID=A0A7S3GEQ3_9EUKA|mmetsp:Transcript_46176/g.118990  ORF Transcript_46176/g.118990 Transcript_46176/m.118990 type:complete len:187 (+) Transcript_46176:434-994(+)